MVNLRSYITQTSGAACQPKLGLLTLAAWSLIVASLAPVHCIGWKELASDKRSAVKTSISKVISDMSADPLDIIQLGRQRLIEMRDGGKRAGGAEQQVDRLEPEANEKPAQPEPEPEPSSPIETSSGAALGHQTPESAAEALAGELAPAPAAGAPPTVVAAEAPSTPPGEPSASGKISTGEPHLSGPSAEPSERELAGPETTAGDAKQPASDRLSAHVSSVASASSPPSGQEWAPAPELVALPIAPTSAAMEQHMSATQAAHLEEAHGPSEETEQEEAEEPDEADEGEPEAPQPKPAHFVQEAGFLAPGELPLELENRDRLPPDEHLSEAEDERARRIMGDLDELPGRMNALPELDNHFERTYIDHSNPADPRQVHIRQRHRSRLEPDSESHHHEESKTARSLTRPNSFSRRFSSSSYSMRRSGGRKGGRRSRARRHRARWEPVEQAAQQNRWSAAAGAGHRRHRRLPKSQRAPHDFGGRNFGTITHLHAAVPAPILYNPYAASGWANAGAYTHNYAAYVPDAAAAAYSSGHGVTQVNQFSGAYPGVSSATALAYGPAPDAFWPGQQAGLYPTPAAGRSRRRAARDRGHKLFRQ